jgi:hypothetical protein
VRESHFIIAIDTGQGLLISTPMWTARSGEVKSGGEASE